VAELVLKAFEKNIKLVMAEFRLDGSSFISGLEFIATAPADLAEERLIPKIFEACIDVEIERPQHDSVAASSQNDDIEWEPFPENVDLSVAYLGILVTAVMVRAILMTPNAKQEEFVVALKNLNLLPSNYEDSIPKRAAKLCEVKERPRDDLLVPPLIKRDGLTFEEHRKIIADRLSRDQDLMSRLKNEAEHQIARTVGANKPRAVNPGTEIAELTAEVEARPPVNERARSEVTTQPFRPEQIEPVTPTASPVPTSSQMQNASLPVSPQSPRVMSAP
jgi:hypothetical protein